MKKFLGILVLGLFLITPSWADDIRDFEIEGISLGDSLLKIYSKKEVETFLKNKDQINFYPKSKKFIVLATPGNKGEFDQLNIDLKYSDKKYTIFGISKYKRMNIEKCLEEKKTALLEIKQLFSNDAFEEDSYKLKHSADKSGNSIYYSTDIEFESGDAIRLVCTDWGKEFEADGYGDNFDIGLSAKELLDFLINEAYK